MNPFAVAKVDSPRRVGTIVESLNHAAFAQVLEKFASIKLPAPHRPVRAPRVVHIQSPRAGLGKSHLLGRVFTSIGLDATRIYLLPFQDHRTGWTSVLQTIIEELRRSERIGENDGIDIPDQLDALAHGVFGHALAELIKIGQCTVEGMTDAIGILQRGISQNWDLTNNDLPLTQEFHRKFAELEIYLERQIDILQRDQPVQIRDLSPLLKILYHYARSRENARRRKLCYMWLACTPYDDAENYKNIISPRQLISPEIDATAREQLSRQRIVDLAILSSFYRPFLFCFDQIEYYVEIEASTKRFGEILDYLANYVPNHCTVMTSNHVVWQRMQTIIEKAYLDSIDEPIVLDGLNRAQGIELIHLRMANAAPKLLNRMLDSKWLDSIFDTGEGLIGSRDFLKQCERRFDNSDAPPDDLPALFDKKLRDLSRNRQTVLTFDQDVLIWFCQTLFPKILPSCQCELFDSPKDYYPLRWKFDRTKVLLGFESGNNHRRWGARIDEAARQRNNTGSVTLHLRTPSCPKLPGNATNLPPQSGFFLESLGFDDLSLIHASRHLLLDACDGSIRYSSAEVIEYAASQTKPLGERIFGRLNGGVIAPLESPLPGLITRVVREILFLSLDRLVSVLKTECNVTTTEQEVLNCCHQIESVEVHAAGSQVVLHYIEE